MITIKIDEDTLLDMLMDRVKVWTDDDVVLKLFENMYDSLVYGGCFDGAEVDIMSIVDNDYINYKSVIYKEEYPEDWDRLLDFYKKGERDVSCEHFDKISCSYIESVSDDEEVMLVSY